MFWDISSPFPRVQFYLDTHPSCNDLYFPLWTNLLSFQFHMPVCKNVCNLVIATRTDSHTDALPSIPNAFLTSCHPLWASLPLQSTSVLLNKSTHLHALNLMARTVTGLIRNGGKSKFRSQLCIYSTFQQPNLALSRYSCPHHASKCFLLGLLPWCHEWRVGWLRASADVPVIWWKGCWVHLFWKTLFYDVFLFFFSWQSHSRR